MNLVDLLVSVYFVVLRRIPLAGTMKWTCYYSVFLSELTVMSVIIDHVISSAFFYLRT